MRRQKKRASAATEALIYPWKGNSVMSKLYDIQLQIAKEIIELEEDFQKKKRPSNFELGYYVCLQVMHKELLNIKEANHE